MGSVTVGRPKKKPADPARKPVAITIKGDEEWRKWVERAATHCRMSVSGLADFGITLAAKQQGFEEKPPKRLS